MKEWLSDKSCRSSLRPLDGSRLSAKPVGTLRNDRRAVHAQQVGDADSGQPKNDDVARRRIDVRDCVLATCRSHTRVRNIVLGVIQHANGVERKVGRTVKKLYKPAP